MTDLVRPNASSNLTVSLQPQPRRPQSGL